MLKTGILNPALNSLLSRVRHTNMLVIADHDFPFWPQIETIDLALIRGIPTVLDVVRALRPNFNIGHAWMADEFFKVNPKPAQAAFKEALSGIKLTHETHSHFKHRVHQAVGLIRTGDTTPYSNLILESA